MIRKGMMSMTQENAKVSMTLDNWRMAIVPHIAHFAARTIAELEQSGHTVIPSQAPGNFELAMRLHGLLPLRRRQVNFT